MRRSLRRLLGLDFQEPEETAYAARKLMQLAADDIQAGRSKAARIIDKGPNRAKTHTSWVKRQLLRGEFRRRV